MEQPEPPEPDGQSAALRDGSRVLVRRVRPDDGPLFEDGFEQLGEQSRYSRFLGHKQRLSERELFFFTHVDHRDHEAIGAIDPDTGRGLGVARYVRCAGQPEAAEAAVAVVDEWQGRGLGSLLLERLVARAAEEEVTHFKASLLTENHAMLRTFEHVGASMKVRPAGLGLSLVDVELPVDPAAAQELASALRAAAAGDLVIADPLRDE